MIVKVQWPVRGDQILIYNQRQTIKQLFPVNDHIKELMFGSKDPNKVNIKEYKQYFHARINKDNNLVLMGRAPEQSW